MPAGNDITNLIRFIRADIGDDGANQSYTDTQIITLVAKAASRLDAKLSEGSASSGGFIAFEQATSGSTFLASGTFTLPSGASTGGLPNELFNLIVLQTECILAKRANFDAAGKAIRVRDGDTEIDTSVGFKGLISLVSEDGGPCKELEKALSDYISGQEGDVTQYGSLIWKGNVRKWETHAAVGPDGEVKVEIMPTFGDFLEGDRNKGNDDSQISRLA